MKNIHASNNTIGSRIKEERSRLKLSQEKLSENLGYCSNYIYQIESGKRNASIEALVAMADYFKVSLDYLVRGYTKLSGDELDIIIKRYTPEQRQALAKALKAISK